MTNKCSRKIFIKSYRRSDGTKVKGHCSRPKGRKSRGTSRKISKLSKKLVCTPPKSTRVKSFRRSNGKRVKAHCSRPRGGRRTFKELPSTLMGRGQEEKYPEEEEPRVSPCSDLPSSECNAALDKNNLRRCRVNMMTRLCEELPQEFRERATYQVGGSAEYVPYQAGERQRLSGERLRPFQREESERRLNRLIDENERSIQEAQRFLREN